MTRSQSSVPVRFNPTMGNFTPNAGDGRVKLCAVPDIESAEIRQECDFSNYEPPNVGPALAGVTKETSDQKATIRVIVISPRITKPSR